MKGLLIPIMTLVVLSAFVIAVAPGESSGSVDLDGCTEEVTWSFDSDTGTLTISGNGAMEDYTYINVPWIEYRSSIRSVVIGDSVKSVGAYAFCECTSLVSLTLPDSVTSVGHSAFYGCTSLVSIDFGASVNRIDTLAFADCTSLAGIYLPDTISEIGESAFRNCTGLKELTLPASTDSVRSNDNPAFSGCVNIEKITFLAGDGNWFEYGTDSSSSSSNIYAPWQLSKSVLKTIILSDGIQTLGAGAFSGCVALKELSVPVNLNCVVSNDLPAFSGCNSIEKMIFTAGTGPWFPYSSATYLPSYYGYTPWTLNKCHLYSVNIADGVESIGDYAFDGCVVLESALLPDSVTSIGSYAFYGCTSLTSVNIPNSVTVLCDHLFEFCYNLSSITLPENLTFIGDYVFDSCRSLPSLNLGKHIDTIGVAAFMGCSSFTSMVIPDSVTSLGDKAFFDCSSLSEIVIGRSVERIGCSTFFQCKSLVRVTIPEVVRSIGDNAFEFCSSLISVDIDNLNASIGTLAFAHCTSLKTLTLYPKSHCPIGDYAFYGCTSLSEVTIGSGVSTIGVSAFAQCPIDRVVFCGKLSFIAENAFGIISFWDKNFNRLDIDAKVLSNHTFSGSDYHLTMN